MDEALVFRADRIDLDSNGYVVFSQPETGGIYRVHEGLGVIQAIYNSHQPGGPMNFDVDSEGTVGPVDDILYAHIVVYEGGYQRVSMDPTVNVHEHHLLGTLRSQNLINESLIFRRGSLLR